jgi:hypothetical protein
VTVDERVVVVLVCVPVIAVLPGVERIVGMMVRDMKVIVSMNPGGVGMLRLFTLALGVLGPPAGSRFHLASSLGMALAERVPRARCGHPVMSTIGLHGWPHICRVHDQEESHMATAKRTKTIGMHKDSARKHSVNPPAGGGSPESASAGMQAQDPKRRIGQHTGSGEPPLMKK